MKTTLPILALILLGLALLYGCRGNNAHKDNRPVITVSIEPLRYIVEQIAGDKYRVNTLVPPGSSPETYEPTPRQMIDLGESEVFFKVGTLGLESTRLNEMTNNAPHTVVIELSQGISLIAGGDCREHSSDGADQHTWMSPANAAAMARNAFDALCRIDSKNQAYYAKRLEAFEKKTDSIDNYIRQKLGKISTRTFLIYHPALGYYAHRYGLRQISVEMDGKEPSVERVKDLVALCRNDGVKVVFVQREQPGRTAKRIAREAGVNVVEINPLDYHWDRQMVEIANALEEYGK